MKPTQMRELTADDLTARVAELERERFNLQFRSGTQALDDPLRLRVIRRELARLKTILREKTTGTAAAGAATRTGGK